MRCRVAPCRCGMLPIHVANIIIICNIVCILTIYFAINFTALSFKTHPHTMPAHRRGSHGMKRTKKSRYGGDARHSHPSPLRKKSRLRRKKTRLPLTVGHRVYQGWYILTGWFHATTDLRGSFLWLLSYTFSPSFAKGGGIGGIRVRLAPLGWRCALSRHLFCLFRGGKES